MIKFNKTWDRWFKFYDETMYVAYWGVLDSVKTFLKSIGISLKGEEFRLACVVLSICKWRSRLLEEDDIISRCGLCYYQYEVKGTYKPYCISKGYRKFRCRQVREIWKGYTSEYQRNLCARSDFTREEQKEILERLYQYYKEQYKIYMSMG